MKQRQINLVQSRYSDDHYIVDSLVNRVEPLVGSTLKPTQVQELIALPDTKVTIKRSR